MAKNVLMRYKDEGITHFYRLIPCNIFSDANNVDLQRSIDRKGAEGFYTVSGRTTHDTKIN